MRGEVILCACPALNVWQRYGAAAYATCFLYQFCTGFDRVLAAQEKPLHEAEAMTL